MDEILRHFQLGKTCAVVMNRGVIIPGFLRCEMDFVHSQYVPSKKNKQSLLQATHLKLARNRFLKAKKTGVTGSSNLRLLSPDFEGFDRKLLPPPPNWSRAYD